MRVDDSVRPLVTECADAPMSGADPRLVLRRFVQYLPESTVVIDRIDLVQDQDLFDDMVWVLHNCRQIKAVVAARGRTFFDSPSVAFTLDTALIGSETFQLSVAETDELLSIRGISMDPAELCEATGGHPLLTRATMTVYGQSGTGSICASVRTAVSDFLQMSLAQSTLEQQAKDFMVRTSIPESLALDLAAQLSGAHNITALLNDLEDQGLGMWFEISGHRRFEYIAAVRALLRSVWPIVSMEPARSSSSVRLYWLQR